MFGMPRQAILRGAVDVLGLTQIGAALRRQVARLP